MSRATVTDARPTHRDESGNMVQVRLASTPGRIEVQWLSGIRAGLGWFEHPDEFEARHLLILEDRAEPDHRGLAGLLLALSMGFPIPLPEPDSVGGAQ